MLRAAMADLEPPAHVRLREGDRAFWTAIIRARTRDEWTEADLVLAGQLARCLADIEREQALLDAEGTVTASGMNPRVSVAEQYARRAQALMRTLRMGGRAAGRTADSQPARLLERQARSVLQSASDDGLLA